MWQEKLKEIIYILENSNVNEIEVSFWGKKFRVVKSGHSVMNNSSEPANVQVQNLETQSIVKDKSLEKELTKTLSEGEDLL